ncbi:MAG: hypothetical protein OER90_12260 [Gemmatimonadota bacterium]|nr:hypothetical protein [Gemmatimonadota bacterium]
MTQTVSPTARRPLAWAAVGYMVWASAACGAGWHRPASMPSGGLDPGQQVRVWHDGAVERWHSVVIRADSVLGVPWLEPRGCDTCRVGLARSEVDSVHVGNPMGGFWRTIGVALLIMLAITAPFWL